MSAKTKIDYVDATWNPVTGCSPCSPGCENCFARRMVARFHGKKGWPDDFRPRTWPERLTQPAEWKTPKTIFVSDMGDLFHDNVPLPFIKSVFDVMRQNCRHCCLVLTKRALRMRAFDEYSSAFGYPWPPNVWAGVSVDGLIGEDHRIENLHHVTAPIRFISFEPLIGHYPMNAIDPCGIGWIIVGGETGPGARPMDINWVRQIRDWCLRWGIPFWFKSWGTGSEFRGDELDGDRWKQKPTTLDISR